MLEQLNRIYGAPHELLHVLALLLIGRRALKYSSRQVVIPSNLTTAQYIFVAGLPALVFFGCVALGAVGLLNAHTPRQAGIAVGVILAAGFGAAGTIGDLQLIAARLSGGNRR